MTDRMITLSLVQLDGTELFGPELMPSSMTIAEVRSLAKSLKVSETPYDVALLHGAEEISSQVDHAQIGGMMSGQALQVSVIYASLELSAELRQQILMDLNNRKCRFSDLPAAARADKGIVVAALQDDRGFPRYPRPSPDFFQDVHESIRFDKDIAMAVVRAQPACLQYADEPTRADRGVVAAGFFPGTGKGGADFSTFGYALDSIRSDVTFIFNIMKRYGQDNYHDCRMQILPKINPALLSDEGFLCELARVDPQSFRCLSNSAPMHADRLVCADATLKSNKPFMKQLIGRCPNCLRYADAALRHDAGFVLEVVCQNARAIRALKHAPTELLADEGFMLAAIKARPRAMQHADVCLREGVSFVMEAISANPAVLVYCLERILVDTKVVGVIGAAVARDCFILKSVPLTQRSDVDFMLEMVRHNWRALGFIHHRLTRDKDFLERAKLLRKRH